MLNHCAKTALPFSISSLKTNIKDAIKEIKL